MKKNITKKIRHSLKALTLVIAGIFAFGASAQTITIDSSTVSGGGPYYPYADFGVRYETEANEYLSGVVFYSALDSENDVILDAEDHLFGQSTADSALIVGSLPRTTGFTRARVFATNGGTLPEEGAYSVENIQSSTFTVQGTDGGNVNFNAAGSLRQLRTAGDFDFSDEAFVTLRVQINATNVTTDTALVVSYTTDSFGDDINTLTSIGGLTSISDTSATIYYRVPESALGDSVGFQIRQTNSLSISALGAESWSITSLDLIKSNTDFIQYASQFVGSLSISSPTLSLTNEVSTDTVGGSFSLAYEALGFTTGANFYYYTGDILDSANRVIYSQKTASIDTLSGQFPLEDTDDIDASLKVAAIYGNINDPDITFEDDDVTIRGNATSNTDFTFTFNQNGTRSLTTDAVNLSGESFLTLEIDFGNGTNSTNEDNQLKVQYSTNGTTWVTLDSLLLSEARLTVQTWRLTGGVISATTRIRVIQDSADNGSANTWSIDGIKIDKYIQDFQQDRTTYNLRNYTATLSNNNIPLNGEMRPGDSIAVVVDVFGFDVSDEKYVVIMSNEYDSYILPYDSVQYDTAGVNNSFTLSSFIPLDIDYDSTFTITVRAYKGDSPQVGVNEDVFGDYMEDDFMISSGELNANGNEVSFTEAGERSFTTPSFNISSVDNLVLAYDIARINSVRSPSGTEIIVEYSTDGSTFTAINDSVTSINVSGTAGSSYTITSIPAAAASSSTYFRFRQANNNGAGLDSWKLSDVTLTKESNLFLPDYLDYSGAPSVKVVAPTISLSAVDDAGVDLFPGASFTVEMEVTSGDFPSGTSFELFLARNGADDFPIVLGTVTSLTEDKATFTASVPSIIAGNYNLMVVADEQEIMSNTTVLRVLGIEIIDINISSDDALVDGSSSVIYPGSEIDVIYDVDGTLGTGVTASLMVKDGKGTTTVNDDEYISLATMQNVGDTITATLPIGLDYKGDPEFKLSLMNGNLETVSSIFNTATVDDDIDELFPEDMREAYTSGNVYANETGVRTARAAVSAAFDLSDYRQVAVKLDLQIQNGTFEDDQYIYVDYSIDSGETWVALDSTEMESANTNFFPDYISLPEVAITSATHIRWITNEDAVFTGTENSIEFSAFNLRAVTLDAISTAEFKLSDSNIGLENLSVSVSDLGDPEYRLGEEFVVEYNADGPFPSDVTFAVVLEKSDTTLILAESTDRGAVQLTVNFPNYAIGDSENAYKLNVEPFIKVNDNDTYRAAAVKTSITDEDDFLVIEGGELVTVTEESVAEQQTSSSSSSEESSTSFVTTSTTVERFRFDKAGERSLLTKAYDLTATDTVTLNFQFNYPGTAPSTLLALPMLQVSTDGGATFDTLAVEGSDYEEEKYLFGNISASVAISAEYLTEATHFRWFQALNRGEDQNEWTVSGIEIVEGETNSYASANWQRGPNNAANNGQDVFDLAPSLDDYIWSQSDPNDAVFNGETFDFSWNINETRIDASTFPAGTEFEFVLTGVNDPETNEDYSFGTTEEFGDFEADVPFYVENNSYEIGLFASLVVTNPVSGEEELYYFFEGDSVATLDIFNRAVKTTYIGTDDLATLYAGSDVTFSIDVENDQSSPALEGLTSNLIVNFDSEDWLLSTQEGTEDITVSLPPFISDGRDDNGNVNFRVEFSEEGPIGTVGLRLDDADDELTSIEDDKDNFLSGDTTNTGDVRLPSGSGRRVITTIDFDSEDLTDVELFQFDVNFDQISTDISVDQHVVFEYSIDEGVSYIQVDTFPAPGSDEAFDDEVAYEVGDDVKASGVRFRWRQNEEKGTFVLDNMLFTYAQSLPFTYIPADVSISDQSVSVISLDQDEICAGDSITLTYDIKGKFGDALALEVIYSNDVTSESDTLTNAFAGISEGSGSVKFVMPVSAFRDESVNPQFAYRVSITDNTFDEDGDSYDSDFSSTSAYSDERLELVLPISDNVGFSVGTVTACDPDVVTATVTNPQLYFMYEVVNVVDGAVLGSLVYDEEKQEDTDSDIEIGTFTEDTDLQLRVTSMTSGGTVCNTKLVVGTETVDFIENFELSFNQNDLDPVMTGIDSVVICEGASLGQMLYLVNASETTLPADSADVEWFFNDLNNPLDVTTTGFNGNGSETVSGTYFARITQGDCSYLTESIKVVVLATPDMPEITVSGDDGFCAGEGQVTLTATAGYAFYNWTATGGGVLPTPTPTGNVITVEDGGSYSVEVSNVAFESGCTATSEAVDIEVNDQIEFLLYSDVLETEIDGTEVLTGCGTVTVKMQDLDFDDLSIAGTGLYSLYQVGGAVVSTTTSAGFDISESGTYYIEATNGVNTFSCSTRSVDFEVSVTESVDITPVITSTGAKSICEGGTVTLSATTGFAHYRWKRDNLVELATTGETITVDVGGDYTVEVSNVPFSSDNTSCAAESNPFRVNVLPELTLNLNAGSGNLANGEVLDVCSDDNPTLSITGATGDYTVTWFMDSLIMTGISSTATSIDLNASGIYYAEVARKIGGSLSAGNTCTQSTIPVVVNVSDKLDPVAIAAPAETEFCEGEFNLTLTADAGAAYYKWYRRNVGSTGSGSVVLEGTSNTLQVNRDGDYWVTSAMAKNACESDNSNIVTLEELPNADPIIGVRTIAADCSTGDVLLQVGGFSYSTGITSGFNTRTDHVYQLINKSTGENLGEPVIGSGAEVLVTVTGLIESTQVIVEASFANGSGCPVTSSFSAGNAVPNNVVLDLDGTQVTAEVSSFTGNDYEVAWFRNDVLMRNATGTTISITDAATYSVEVTFADGCVVSSNAVALDARAPQAPASAAANGRIVAKTYPNPTASSVNLDVPGDNMGTYSVQIMTISGKVMLSGTFTKSEKTHIEQIDISDLEKGIYNVVVSKGKKVDNIRIVKQ